MNHLCSLKCMLRSEHRNLTPHKQANHAKDRSDLNYCSFPFLYQLHLKMLEVGMVGKLKVSCLYRETTALTSSQVLPQTRCKAIIHFFWRGRGKQVFYFPPFKKSHHLISAKLLFLKTRTVSWEFRWFAPKHFGVNMAVLM